MAGFTVNFNANTTGDHYICYRDIGSGDPFTCVTENVVSVGPNSVSIDVPNNIYCETARLEGYIIAACQDQTDLNGDGIPDLAITFSVTLPQQTDPCPLYTITCASAGIAAVQVDNTPSANWVSGPEGPFPLVFTDGTAITPATGDIRVDGSDQFTVNIVDPGEYTVAPSTIDLSSFSNYLTATPPNFTVLMASCDNLDIRDIDCNGDWGLTSPLPEIAIPFGDSIQTCVDEASLASLPSSFSAEASGSTCHCIDCQGLYITNAVGKTITISYQTCWEDNDVDGY